MSPLRLEGDYDKPFLDGARPEEIAAERPLLATRHFHTHDTGSDKAIEKHDPNRGNASDKPADTFQRRLRDGSDPIASRAAKGEI